MPTYILLMRLSSKGCAAVRDDPDSIGALREALERWESKVLSEFQCLGEYDHCVIFEAPDNFHAYRASLEQELSSTAETEILAAIDLPLFQRMMTQTSGTVGPHAWQIRWWAKLGRLGFRRHAYTRWVRAACKPLTVTGRENLRDVKGPCIVVGNHTSHLDALVLFQALPQRIKWNVYFGAAADRWFVKGRKELVMQPWYQSLAVGSFPIQRGGGSKTLDYPKWLLDRGCNLVIFPEGTRSTSRKLAKFRHGVSILALEKNVPVVPIYLSGLNKLRPKGSREIFPGPGYAHFLPPLRFAPGTEVPDATRQIFAALNEAHTKVTNEGPEVLYAGS